MTNNDDLALKMKEVDVHRIAACVSACEGISTENLINNVPLKQGLSGLNKRIRDAESQRDELLAERDDYKKRIAELVSAIGSINHGKHHEVMIPGDDEPVYWQRKEWVEWILELAAGINLEVGE